jgi:ABC-2 type transport system permease protein
MGRSDYAMARLLSLATALFLVLMVPVIALFIGDILMGTDAFKAVESEWPKALPSIPSNLLIAASMASIALALSSYSPRRAYAAVGVLAYFLLVEFVPIVIYGIGHEAGAKWVDVLPLITPITGLSRANDWFFGVPIPVDFPSSIGAGVYVLAGLVSTLLFTGILVWRYRRIAA